MVSAWDAGDAAAFSEEFTDDATYVIYVGLVYTGRRAIEEGHVPVFEKWQKGTRMSMLVREIRFLGDATAVVLTEGGIGKRTIRRDKVQTYTFVREADGRWRCTAFQNTRKNSLFIRMNALSSPRP
ncbi:SgcJ/EcaC family oxidoreductase [Leifsonia sp. 1010]|uniref:SgcJ/EcaC family oxidoreductase n=1 Tax=Leifsonia sp. 1010 TaxID=2817769 RepID=UPI00286134B7|nr:SgcJ/EcaC family oxidoreductase [Leifsonia sp. 1010]MDR6610673.1 uncharacterized protein (TIGR02246 family) [Leifsonia sp. 1010]